MLLHTPKNVAIALKDYRKRHGLTQAALADRVGLRQATVSDFENKPELVTLDTLVKITSGLELEIVIRPRDTPIAGWDEEW